MLVIALDRHQPVEQGAEVVDASGLEPIAVTAAVEARRGARLPSEIPLSATAAASSRVMSITSASPRVRRRISELWTATGSS